MHSQQWQEQHQPQGGRKRKHRKRSTMKRSVSVKLSCNKAMTAMVRDRVLPMVLRPLQTPQPGTPEVPVPDRLRLPTHQLLPHWLKQCIRQELMRNRCPNQRTRRRLCLPSNAISNICRPKPQERGVMNLRCLTRLVLQARKLGLRSPC